VKEINWKQKVSKERKEEGERGGRYRAQRGSKIRFALFSKRKQVIHEHFMVNARHL
jgi:hypothetical protein